MTSITISLDELESLLMEGLNSSGGDIEVNDTY